MFLQTSDGRFLAPLDACWTK